MASVLEGIEILLKIANAGVGCMNVTDRKDRVTDDDI